jgi:hypothetical protein
VRALERVVVPPQRKTITANRQCGRRIQPPRGLYVLHENARVLAWMRWLLG